MDRSDLFGDDTSVFADKNLLEISHLPGSDRIVGREEQLSELGSILNPGLYGQSPSNALLYGKTGTGKSLCTKFVTQEMIKEATDREIVSGMTYVDCAQDNTETRAVRAIAQTLQTPAVDVTLPDTGIGTSTYYNRLWKILDEIYDVAVIVLDEIDRLDDDNLLMQLSRAGEAEKVKDCKIGIIGISNKINYRKRMTERVHSSLCERELVFQPYDADQLRKIMEARRDAFREGALADGAIALAAAQAAQEHGDARKAIDILRFAGEIAEGAGDDQVRESHVRQARERAEQNRFRELIRGSPPHAKHVLIALSTLTLNNEMTAFRTSDLYSVYENVCEREGTTPVSTRRVHEILREQAFLDVIEQRRIEGGRETGTYTEHELLEDAKVVQDVLTK